MSVFGPFAFIGFCFSLAVFFVSLFIASATQFQRHVLTSCVAFFLCSLVFGIVMCAQKLNASEDRGFIASEVPAVAEWQGALLDALLASVGRIETDVTATRETVEQIADQQSELSAQARREQLRSAFVEADGEALSKLASGNVIPDGLTALFRDRELVAQFLAKSVQDETALAWLTAQLGSGLDPNLLVESDDGAREGLLYTAFSTGNALAMIALLEAGANPHAYQELQRRREQVPFFIGPILHVLDSEHFTYEEIHRIVELMIENGAIIPGSPTGRGFEQFKSVESFYDLFDEYGVGLTASRLEDELEIQVDPLVDICTSGDVGACSDGSPYTNTELCDFTAGMMQSAIADTHGYDGFDNFIVLGLLGVYDRQAHYLAFSLSYGATTAVIRQSVDRRKWTNFRYSRPIMFEMPWCDTENPDYTDMCWLGMPLDYRPVQQELSISNDKFVPRYCPAS